MRYELFISLRYIIAKRRERFISIISLISVLGVAVGVCALIVVLAVMSGFDNDLKDKIVGANAHIVVESQEGIDNPGSVIDSIKDIQGITGIAPFIQGQVVARAKGHALGVYIRGIEQEKEIKVTRIGEYIKEGRLNLDENGIVIGKEFANNLGLALGESLSVVSPYDGKIYELTVKGIFHSGMYEYDANLAFVNLTFAQVFFGLPGKATAIGIKLKDLYSANAIKKLIQERLGPIYTVRSWQDMNKNLFSALKLEKTVMFIILALIVVVAALNIASTLIMVVMEKTKDIGILKSIGATNSSIKAIFTLEGFLIGLIGTVLGACAGLWICFCLKKYQFIHLPPDIYYVDRLPVQVELYDSFMIIMSALIISLIATFYPAHQASRLNPVEALRYE